MEPKFKVNDAVIVPKVYTFDEALRSRPNWTHLCPGNNKLMVSDTGTVIKIDSFIDLDKSEHNIYRVKWKRKIKNVKLKNNVDSLKYILQERNERIGMKFYGK